MVALAAHDRNRQTEPTGEPWGPHSCGEDDGSRVEHAGARLESVDAISVRGEGAHFDAGADDGSCGFGRAADCLDEREWVARELVGVVDRSRDGSAQRRLEGSRIGACHDLGARTFRGTLPALEPLLRLVDVQRAAALDTGREIARELLMPKQARLRERTDRTGSGALLRRRAGRDEARDPRRKRRTCTKRDRSVAVEQAAKSFEECGTSRERLGVARTDQACVALRATGREPRAALEQRHLRATLRELERCADADDSAADHDDVVHAGAG